MADGAGTKTQSPAEVLRGLEPGNVAQINSPLDLDPSEKLELWVTGAREDTGVREIEVRYMGVLMWRTAAKPGTNGGVIWAGL